VLYEIERFAVFAKENNYIISNLLIYINKFMYLQGYCEFKSA